MQPARAFSASLLILLATLRRATTLLAWTLFSLFAHIHSGSAAPISFQTPQHLERTKTFSSGFNSLTALPGGAIAVNIPPESGLGPSALLTNDLTPVVNFSPTFLRFPLAVQADGKLIVKGDTAHYLKRLNHDGSIDPSFVAPEVSPGDTDLLTDIIIQPNGKILVGCATPFQRTSIYPGINHGLFRLNSDGLTDSTFQLESQFSSSFILLLSDGKILQGGVLRYLPDGQFDSSYNIPEKNGQFYSAALQSDGKIIVVGDFDRINGIRRPGLARLNADGSVDFSFNPPAGGGSIVKLQSDGRIVVFDLAVTRFLPDGQLDPTFSYPRSANTLTAFEIGSDDRIYVGEREKLFQLSGRYRVRVPPAEIPIIFERSPFINAGWLPLQLIPANTAFDYVDSNFPGIGNTFYRTRPAQ